ncbi:hypothetical protein GQ44DRAFT_699697 [Phaeosphaeriaceae sp. PMI808]|nr:hypothetical protein GQ44DRAFT_699697 [Phaeosphaeriaceae sp. PMI808]
MPGIKKFVGYMVNMLPIRLRVLPNSSIVELARALQDNYLKNIPRKTIERMQSNVGGSRWPIQNHCQYPEIAPETVVCGCKGEK